MPAPASVRQQAERANQLHRQVYGDGQGTPPGEAPAPPAAPPVPPANVAQQQQPPTDEQQQQPGEVTNWEHKYKTVQGMLASQQQRHQREMQGMQQQLANLNLLVNQLRAAPPQVPAPQPQQRRLVTDEELADYGPDLISVVKRAAKEEVEPELQQLRAENQQLRQQVNGVTQHVQVSAHDRMYERLGREVPEWQAMNNDTEFLQWLAMNDPYSGHQRQAMLNHAVEQADADRVIAFFRGYIDQNAAVAQASNGAGYQPQPHQQRQPQVPLDSLVAPGRPKSTTGQGAQQSNGKGIWTAADIQRFYADVNRGVFKSRPADKARIEEEIIAAGREGRVVR